MVGGTKAIFKFVHTAGPIMSAAHMYDYEVDIKDNFPNNSWFFALQGKELVEEGDGQGHSTLFFLSTKNPVNKADLKQRIEAGVC